MGRLGTLAILATLGAVPRAAFGDQPVNPSPPAHVQSATPARSSGASPGASKRAEPPVPPLKYLKAGARLYNEGRYDLASKYFTAAQMFRDRLTANECIVLDVYREKLDQALRDRVQASAPARPAVSATSLEFPHTLDTGVMAASTVGTARNGPEGDRARLQPDRLIGPDASSAGGPAEPGTGATGLAHTKLPGHEIDPGTERGTVSWRDTADLKQKGRWLLRLAREQIFRGQYDAAARSLAEVQGMSIHWGFFDDSPTKVAEALAKAKSTAPKGGARVGVAGPEQPHDRRAARAKLREARSALAARDIERAEAMANEVKSWGLRHGLLDDTPDKVAADVAEFRRLEAASKDDPRAASYAGATPPGTELPQDGLPRFAGPKTSSSVPR